MISSFYSFSQEKYQPFITEFTKVYNRKLKVFQSKSEKIMEEYLYSKQEEINEEKDKYEHLFIPQLLLKK